MDVNLTKLSTEELEKLKYEIEGKISKFSSAEKALKILMNAEFGALGNRWFRYYDLRLASAITLSGQLSIRWVEKYLSNHSLRKKYKWEVIYSDTDSIYITFKWLAEKLLSKYNNDKLVVVEKLDKFSKKIIQPIIDEAYENLKEYVNANENRMFMKQEKISSRGLWTSKKKYALLVYNDEGVIHQEPELKVKGIEIVRSSTPKFVKERLKHVIKLILTDSEGLGEYIKTVKKEFFEAEPEDIAFATSVNTMSKYETVIKDFNGETELHYKKGTPVGVRAAINYNKFIIKNDLYKKYPLIKEGDKIRWVYLRLPNIVKENVFGFINAIPERELIREYIDYENQFYKTFLKPIENITSKIRFLIEYGKKIEINELF